jgi:hypothetical protein
MVFVPAIRRRDEQRVLETMIGVSEPMFSLESGVDLRLCFLRSRTANRMVEYFVDLYRQIEEECEPASTVLEKLGLVRKADALVFYRFRKRCIRWGVWMSEQDFAASSKGRYFDPARICHWSHLCPYLEKGMVPALTASPAILVSADQSGEDVVTANRAVNRKKLRKLPLDVWVKMGFSATEIWRFLRPFLQGLTWWQVYLHLREGWRKGWNKIQHVGVAFGLVSPRGEVVEESDILAVDSEFKAEETSGTPKEPQEEVHSGGDLPREIVVLPGSDVGSTTVAVGSASALEGNGLLKLFGNLPDAGRVDDFLFSAGGAKLRSAKFWQEVNEAAGASFSGRFEFGGMALQCECDELGNLPGWCEEFALALTKALGFKEQNFRGAMAGHPSKCRSFNSWFVVLGHLLETVREDKGRCGELESYFRESRIHLRMPNGVLVEIATLEESFYRYLVLVGPFGLSGVNAVNVINLLAIEWMKWSKLLFKFGIPWRSEVDYELFLQYAKVVFSMDPGISGANELETEIRRNLFKPDTFEEFPAESTS